MMIKLLSPIDSRYGKVTNILNEYFSEWALLKYRVEIEVRWLLTMSSIPYFKEVRSFTSDEIDLLMNLINNFDDAAALKIKEIERTTNHDVKAVEYYIKSVLQNTSLVDVMEFVHFGCTSEDINNLSYALMLKHGIENAWLPKAEALVQMVGELAEKYKDISILSHTHGQPATPTTIGKELAIFAYRWNRQLRQVRNNEYLGKFSGVVGNFNAQMISYPDLPWEEIAQKFVEDMGITYNPLTTQIESHDYMAECFHVINRFNNILMDFNRDIWLYISMEYFKQNPIEGQVGSSTMPHKINPINFETSEANLGLSNSILGHLADKLAVSRLQRDLSDSSAQRNIGLGIAYSYLSIHYTQTGLSQLSVNQKAIDNDLDNSWEVLAEPIQTVMRKCGYDKPYEKLKELTRGKKVNREDISKFIESLELPEEDKQNLRALTPAKYIGIAPQLVRHIKD